MFVDVILLNVILDPILQKELDVFCFWKVIATQNTSASLCSILTYQISSTPIRLLNFQEFLNTLPLFPHPDLFQLSVY